MRQARCLNILLLFLLFVCFDLFAIHVVIYISSTDDGTGPDKIAHIMGPPDRCDHAARIIGDLLQSLRVSDGECVGTDREVHLL